MTKRKTRAEKLATPLCHPHCKRKRDGSVRHVLTHEEKQRGFENMVTSAKWPPDLICTYHGCHFAGCMLKHKFPLYFAARTLKRKVDKMKPRGPEDRAKLAKLKRGVARLMKNARSETQRVTTRNRRRDSICKRRG
jgi:hypothetical protein